MSTATGRLNWPFAATWAACTGIGWLMAIAWAGPDWNATTFFLAGIFAQLVTVALRWRLIITRHRQPLALDYATGSPPTGWLEAAASNDHAVTWLLCWLSHLHLIGVTLLAAGLMAGLSLAVALLTCEFLLLRFAPGQWNELLPDGWPAAFRPSQAHNPLLEPWDESSEREDDFEDDLDDLADDSEFESEFEAAKLSATFHGKSDDGLPYLQGWQRYELAAGQKSMIVTVGFFPPFFTVPDCQLDHEGDEEVGYEIEHITPAVYAWC